MKKIIFSLVALVCSMSMNAQVMKLMKNGVEVATYTGAEYTVEFEKTSTGEESASSTTGTAMRTGDVEVRWVQLWENGPKFAEYNVGAASATEFGGHYAWGGSQDQVDDHNTGTDVLAGDADTATKLWGSAWRMPTQAELQALLDNCDVEFTSINGTKGRKFTGKGDYASNFVFFPAAGYHVKNNGEVDDEVVATNSEGFYWSSTPDEGIYAYNLDFFSGRQSVYATDRSSGLSVRAVLVEKEATNKTYQVYLENVGPNKIAVVKAVKESLGIGLKEAKDLVDSAPCVLLEGCTMEEAEALAAALREVGATVTVKNLDEEGISDPETTGTIQVVLEDVGPNKLAVVKAVKESLGIGLQEAKNLVESAPCVLLEGCTMEEAEALAATLREVGATVTVKRIAEDE